MKFVCMKCETYMNFEKVEKPGEGSLGVFFGCPSCGARFTMVTNPGETQMVSSLGVQLGGPVSYGGRPERRPRLGDGAAPDTATVRRAVRLSLAVGAATTVLCAAAREACR